MLNECKLIVDQIVNQHCVQNDSKEGIEQVGFVDWIPVEQGETRISRASEVEHFLKFEFQMKGLGSHHQSIDAFFTFGNLFWEISFVVINWEQLF